MANGFGLDSEQLQQSPQQQQLAAQQPMPAQGQGGGFNLLDILSGIGNVIAETGAYYAAAQGRPQLLQSMQEQEKQGKLLQQLQSISKQEMEGPFGGALSQALNMGDLQGAQKIVSNIPKYREFEKALPGLDLSEAERQSVKAIAALDPEVGTDLLKRIIGEKAVLGRQKEVVATTEAARSAREERAEARKKSQTPAKLLAEEFKAGRIDPDDVESQMGFLRGQNIRIPGTPAEQQLWARSLLASPEVKQYIPPKQKKSWLQRSQDFLFGESKAAPAPVMPTPATAAPVRKYNPATGRVE